MCRGQITSVSPCRQVHGPNSPDFLECICASSGSVSTLQGGVHGFERNLSLSRCAEA